MQTYILSVSKPYEFGLGKDDEFLILSKKDAAMEDKKGWEVTLEGSVTDPSGKKHTNVALFCRFQEAKITDVDRGIRIRVQVLSCPDYKTFIGIGNLRAKGS